MGKGRTTIIVRTSFVGWHCWPDAPPEVAFLRSSHRHKFFVEVEFGVTSSDRQLEYFLVLKEVNEEIDVVYGPNFNLKERSCETICIELASGLIAQRGLKTLLSISVFEDDENGSKFYVER